MVLNLSALKDIYCTTVFTVAKFPHKFLEDSFSTISLDYNVCYPVPKVAPTVDTTALVQQRPSLQSLPQYCLLHNLVNTVKWLN